MHDPLCYVAKNGGNCCPWMPSCDCQCMCDWIAEIRKDEHENNGYEKEYYDLLSESSALRHEVQVLRSVIKHMIDKHGVEKPKVNGIPVSEWNGEMSLRTWTGEEE